MHTLEVLVDILLPRELKVAVVNVALVSFADTSVLSRVYAAKTRIGRSNVKDCHSINYQ